MVTWKVGMKTLPQIQGQTWRCVEDPYRYNRLQWIHVSGSNQELNPTDPLPDKEDPLTANLMAGPRDARACFNILREAIGLDDKWEDLPLYEQEAWAKIAQGAP